MNDKTIDKLNELIRGERAACETYKQALDQVGTDPRADSLRENKANHLEAVRTLKKFVQFDGEDPAVDSGAWGGFAKTVVGTAKLFGDQATLKAIKEGEEHGLKEYQELAKMQDINPSIRQEIESKFIPRQHAHITSINGVMEKIK